MLTEGHAATCCAQAHPGQHAARMLALICVGMAFVLNAYLANWAYPGNPLVSEVSAFVGALILAAPIFRTAVRDLARGELHMNELVAVAVLAAMVQGDFKTAGVVAFFMLISLVIETRTAEGAHASIESLIRLAPATARRLAEDGTEESVAAADLRIGDRVRVLPGEDMPADGTVLHGASALNEASITGESLPRDKGPGEEVFAGSQNLTGSLEVHVTRVGEDTTLGRVRELILAAEKTKLPIMMVVDRYIGYYTPVILMLAGLVWFFSEDWQRVISLLIVACPCALILATPTAMVAALSAAARLGILVKNVTDLEAAGRITAMVFDKTGTLTTGELGVSRLAPQEGVSPSELLAAAASTARRSNHPTAQALRRLAEEVGLELADPDEVHEEPGQGMRARVQDQPVVIGRASWLAANQVAGAELGESGLDEAEGYSVLFVARASVCLGWIGLQDQVREGAKACIEDLRDLEVKRVAMVTGDRRSVANRVADAIGLNEFQSDCLPQEKVDFVDTVKRDGYRVAVVGDGVNDAPALTAGDTGIAMGAAGSDVAIHSASVALMSNDLMRIPFLVRLSRAARRVIHQNLAVGAFFIVGGLFLSGLGKLNPIVAALLHNAGSLVVVFNSFRLIRSGEELEQTEPSRPPSTAALAAATADTTA
jgi:Cd2+/Zn2+-exporting ATPase